MVIFSRNTWPSPHTMPPSVCAARFCGCTAIPASMAAQMLCTLIVPVARSTETSATPAANVSSFSMTATPRAVPSRLRFQSDIWATVRSSSWTRDSPAAISMRKAIGSFASSLAISSRKLSIAKALEKEPTPRTEESRAPQAWTTCSESLFGTGYWRSSDPFMMTASCAAGGVEAGLDVVRGHRPELAGQNVVLAAPDHLDGLAQGLGQAHRLEHHVLRAAAPAIAAAQNMLVERDLAAIGAEKARDLVVQPGRVLCADPDFRRLAIRGDPGGRIHRLHLGVIGVARAIFAAEDARGGAHRRLGVADAGELVAGPRLVARNDGEVLKRALRIPMRGWRIGPRDLEGYVDAGQILADVAEARGRLEVPVLDLGQLGWNLGEARDLAIAHAPVRRLVHDHARLGRELADRH